jgi:hypothetical protein
MTSESIFSYARPKHKCLLDYTKYEHTKATKMTPNCITNKSMSSRQERDTVTMHNTSRQILNAKDDRHRFPGPRVHFSLDVCTVRGLRWPQQASIRSSASWPRRTGENLNSRCAGFWFCWHDQSLIGCVL